MNIEKIKSFLTKEELTKSEEVLKNRIISLDTSLTLKKTDLAHLLKKNEEIKGQINSKTAEIFAEEQRLSELCDLVIEMHPEEEVV